MSEHFSERPADFPQAYPLEPAMPAPIGKSPRSAIRYVLPAVLFVVMVGAIAWITQFMPNWRAQTVAPMATGDPGFKFSFNKAVWDREDEEYALEMEKGTKGHFDFPFENLSAQPVELGLLKSNCDCSHLDICLLPTPEWERYSNEIHKNPHTAKEGDWTWDKVETSDTQGFEVPAGAKGLVRVGWQGRREPGFRLRLAIQVWHQPKGKVRQRSFEGLEVPTVMAAPILYSPGRINVGTIIGPRGKAEPAEFTLWSATRDKIELSWADSPNPLFVYESKPLGPDECRALEKKLRKEEQNTRVRAAYHLKVTVYEEAGGKQLDQGPFTHDVALLLDEERVRGPQVFGVVKGEIVVGNSEDRGKIDLRVFRAKDGTARAVSVWADQRVLLEKESQTPATLDVKLKKEETVGTRTKWGLEVAVPPNTQFGPFSEESVIILRTQSNPPRFIRIPVTGNGQS